jgi:hypothetical protein
MFVGTVIVDRISFIHDEFVVINPDPERTGEYMVKLLSLVAAEKYFPLVRLFIIGCLDQKRFRQAVFKEVGQAVVFKALTSFDWKSAAFFDMSVNRKSGTGSGNQITDIQTETGSGLVKKCKREIPLPRFIFKVFGF